VILLPIAGAGGPNVAEAREPPPNPERDEQPRRLADHLLEYVRDPTLWPVLLVAVAIFVTLLAAVLLAALRARSLFAMAALAAVAGVSADAIARELRGGSARVVTIALAALWSLAIAAAVSVVGFGWC
jgi:hypothetical protein